jgi:hypothetical protein
MDLRRFWRHAGMGGKGFRKAFAPSVVATITDAVTAGEGKHHGELCFVAERVFPIDDLLPGRRR